MTVIDIKPVSGMRAFLEALENHTIDVRDLYKYDAIPEKDRTNEGTPYYRLCINPVHDVFMVVGILLARKAIANIIRKEYPDQPEIADRILKVWADELGTDPGNDPPENTQLVRSSTISTSHEAWLWTVNYDDPDLLRPPRKELSGLSDHEANILREAFGPTAGWSQGEAEPLLNPLTPEERMGMKEMFPTLLADNPFDSSINQDEMSKFAKHLEFVRALSLATSPGLSVKKISYLFRLIPYEKKKEYQGPKIIPEKAYQTNHGTQLPFRFGTGRSISEIDEEEWFEAVPATPISPD